MGETDPRKETFKVWKKGGYYLRNTVFTLLLYLIDLYSVLKAILTIFFPFFTGLLLAYLHRKSQCLQLLEHVGVRIQVELWWTQNGSIQDSRWKLEDASKLVGIFGNDEICSQRCKFFSLERLIIFLHLIEIVMIFVNEVWRLLSSVVHYFGRVKFWIFILIFFSLRLPAEINNKTNVRNS